MYIYTHENFSSYLYIQIYTYIYTHINKYVYLYVFSEFLGVPVNPEVGSARLAPRVETQQQRAKRQEFGLICFDGGLFKGDIGIFGLVWGLRM